MKYWRSVANFSYYFCTALILEGLVLAGMISTSLWLKGYRLSAVESSSMTPTFRVGDGVISRQVVVSQMCTGDIVRFVSAENRTKMVSHRIVAKLPAAKLLITKGDSLHTVDTPIRYSTVRGQIIGVVPHIGRLVDIVQTPLGALGFVCLPLVLVALHEAYRSGAAQHRLRYKLHRPSTVNL